MYSAVWVPDDRSFDIEPISRSFKSEDDMINFIKMRELKMNVVYKDDMTTEVIVDGGYYLVFYSAIGSACMGKAK